MRTKSLVASGIVVFLALGAMPVAASAAQLSDKKLEAIAADAMTPLPPALRTEGDSIVDVTTTANPERGLDLCENGERAGLYAVPPQAAIQSVSDVTTAAGSSGQRLSETTVDISRYASPSKAKKAWQGVLRALTTRCAGAVFVPNSTGTLADGSDAIFVSMEFNEVDVVSRKRGPVGLTTTFSNFVYAADDPSRLLGSQVVQQYSSWRLVDNTIVRAEFARQWTPANTAPAIDPATPVMTAKMMKAVDRMARKAAQAMAQN